MSRSRKTTTPSKNPWVLSRDFHLTSAQLEAPTTRDGIVVWAVVHTFGPWCLLPEDIPLDAVLSVSDKSLIKGKRVEIRIVGLNETRTIVRQPDLVRAVAISNFLYFDTAHSLLSSITCSLRGCAAPIEFNFDKSKVCNAINSAHVDDFTAVFLKNRLQGSRVPIRSIEKDMQIAIDYSKDKNKTTALVANILEMSAAVMPCKIGTEARGFDQPQQRSQRR